MSEYNDSVDSLSVFSKSRWRPPLGEGLGVRAVPYIHENRYINVLDISFLGSKLILI